MTYSLIEKEEILFENKLDKLFDEKETVYTHNPDPNNTNTDSKAKQNHLSDIDYAIQQRKIGHWMDRYGDDDIDYLDPSTIASIDPEEKITDPGDGGITHEYKPDPLFTPNTSVEKAAAVTVPLLVKSILKPTNFANLTPSKNVVSTAKVQQRKIKKVISDLTPHTSTRLTPLTKQELAATRRLTALHPIPDGPMQRKTYPATVPSEWEEPKPVEPEKPRPARKKPKRPPKPTITKLTPATLATLQQELSVVEPRPTKPVLLGTPSEVKAAELEAKYRASMDELGKKHRTLYDEWRIKNPAAISNGWQQDTLIKRMERQMELLRAKRNATLVRSGLPELKPFDFTSYAPKFTLAPPPPTPTTIATSAEVIHDLAALKIRRQQLEKLSQKYKDRIAVKTTALPAPLSPSKATLAAQEVQAKELWKAIELDRVNINSLATQFEKKASVVLTHEYIAADLERIREEISTKKYTQVELLKDAKIRTEKLVGKKQSVVALKDLLPDEAAKMALLQHEKLGLQDQLATGESNRTKLLTAQINGASRFNYTVVDGDDIKILANRYDTSVEALMAANPDIGKKPFRKDPKSPYYGFIEAGDKLIIPIEGEVKLLKPGTVWNKQQIDNNLTAKERSTIRPGDKVFIDTDGSIMSGDPSDPANARYINATPTPEEVTARMNLEKTRSTKITQSGDIPKKFLKKYGWPGDAYLVQITDKHGNPRYMLQSDGKPWSRGGRPLFISNGQHKELLGIFNKMAEPPGLLKKTFSLFTKSITVPSKYVLTGTGRLLAGAGRVGLGAIGLGSIKADVISTIAMITVMEWGTGKMLRNSQDQQNKMKVADQRAIAIKIVKDSNNAISYDKALEEVIAANRFDNPLWQLSPAQLRGGLGNFVYYLHHYDKMLGDKGKGGQGISPAIGPIADLAEAFSLDDVITRTMPTSTANGSNFVDMSNSFANMTVNNIKDIPYSDEFVRNNIVSVMLPDGRVFRINPWGLGEPGENGKNNRNNQLGWLGDNTPRTKTEENKQFKNGREAWNAVINNGTVLQVIPLVEEYEEKNASGAMIKKTRKLSIRDQTKDMYTTYMVSETWREDQFKDVYHNVIDKEEPGGKIWIQQGAGAPGKYMYIPLYEEIEPYLLHHIEHLIPKDWYLHWEPKESIISQIIGDEGDKGITMRAKEKQLLALGNDTEAWLKHNLGNRYNEARASNDVWKYAGPMTYRKTIDWWKKYRVENGDCMFDERKVRRNITDLKGCSAVGGKITGIKPPDPKVHTGAYADKGVKNVADIIDNVWGTIMGTMYTQFGLGYSPETRDKFNEIEKEYGINLPFLGNIDGVGERRKLRYNLQQPIPGGQIKSNYLSKFATPEDEAMWNKLEVQIQSLKKQLYPSVATMTALERARLKKPEEYQLQKLKDLEAEQKQYAKAMVQTTIGGMGMALNSDDRPQSAADTVEWNKLEVRITRLTNILSKAKHGGHRTNLNKQIEDLRNEQKQYARDNVAYDPIVGPAVGPAVGQAGYKPRAYGNDITYGKDRTPNKVDETKLREIRIMYARDAARDIDHKGWPTTKQEFFNVTNELASRYGINAKLLRALSRTESGSTSSNGDFKQGDLMGDLSLGIAGAWGLFHVRKETGGRSAAIDDYNKRQAKLNKPFTPVTWEMAARDPLLAAHIGAEHFAYLYKLFDSGARQVPKGSSPEIEAYTAYNAGLGWRKNTKKNDKLRYGKATQARIIARGEKFAGWVIESKNYSNKSAILESKNYSNKSAILEGIALAA